MFRVHRRRRTFLIVAAQDRHFSGAAALLAFTRIYFSKRQFSSAAYQQPPTVRHRQV